MPVVHLKLCALAFLHADLQACIHLAIGSALASLFILSSRLFVCLFFAVPHFDFGELEHDEDVFYTPDARESQEHTCARAVLFLEWLNKVPFPRVFIKLKIVRLCNFQ